MRTIWWQDQTVHLIDQTKLPHQEIIVECRDYPDVANAIATMQIRGAPAIGVTAAYGVALGAWRAPADSVPDLLAQLQPVYETLRATRPTAVNLFWGIDKMRRYADAVAAGTDDADEVRRLLLAEAERLADEDVATNRRMGEYGAALIEDGMNVLTHCNTGALAVVDYGTALGVIRAAWEQGKHIHVWVDETRPFLQGARLTAWELMKLGIPMTLISDNMAGHFMRRGQVDAVFVGADRIAANGDVANKIGTYSVAVLAHENGIPFYSVIPVSTLDLSLASGEQIPIEERDPREVTHIQGVPIAPEGVHVANPAFDVTPNRYVTAIVTNRGVVYPPFEEGLRRVVAESEGNV
ncbi:MAG: S-methyl-5-thioribose-1-phosphate isomerase [Chloroflexi bacterium]|nr:S-methyl-5-thioribose-1-phosphate isomerase [Chloroflexota bacterium]